MLLSEIFPGQPDIDITNISLDSRTIKPGGMFFCVDGAELDGHKFAGKAAEAGAAAIVTTKDVPEVPGVAYVRVEDMDAALNRAADLFFGHPSRQMTMFGATGTNGKSTLTSIIRDVWNHREPCGYMGTISIAYGDYSRVPNLTTPDQIETQSNLAEMRDHGMKACAMEVSSQGLDRARVDAVDFDCVIFTNLTHDHLDYHKTMANYLRAKGRLFRQAKPSAVAVLNADDAASFETLKTECPCRVVTYGTDRGETRVDENGYPIEGSVSKAGDETSIDYFAKNIRLSGKGTEFTLCHGGEEYPVVTNMAALYNIYNLTAAMAAMCEMGMPLADQIPFVSEIPQVDGRMERVDLGQDFTVIVDYAHTPDGYEKIFSYAKEITEQSGGRILASFGCPGKRDTVKRPVMGRIAGTFADRLFITSQDPRESDPKEIAKDILKGVEETGVKWEFIEDRASSIAAAVAAARPGDVVLTLGKGGESYMYVGKGREPWMTDAEACRRALANLGYKKK